MKAQHLLAASMAFAMAAPAAADPSCDALMTFLQGRADKGIKTAVHVAATGTRANGYKTPYWMGGTALLSGARNKNAAGQWNFIQGTGTITREDKTGAPSPTPPTSGAPFTLRIANGQPELKLFWNRLSAGTNPVASIFEPVCFDNWMVFSPKVATDLLAVTIYVQKGRN